MKWMQRLRDLLKSEPPPTMATCADVHVEDECEQRLKEAQLLRRERALTRRVDALEELAHAWESDEHDDPR